MSLLQVSLAALLALSSVVYAGAGKPSDIHTFIDRLSHTVESQDTTACLALWSDKFVSSEDPALSGREAVLSQVGWMLKYEGNSFDGSFAEFETTGETAVARNVHQVNRWGRNRLTLSLTVEDGAWKIIGFEQTGRVPFEEVADGLGQPYLDLTSKWVAWNIGWVDSVRQANPPGTGDRKLREQAHTMLDEPLHLRSATMLEPVQRFLSDGIDRAIEQMQNEQVTSGATIWKLYNHGFVVRTPSHTWAHDLVPGFYDAPLSDKQIDAVLSQVDALFCSHQHGDHTSGSVVRRALEMDIPVFVAPWPEGERGDGWKRWSLVSFGSKDSTTVPVGLTIVPLGGAGQADSLPFTSYPGHQGSTPVSVFVVESDGMRFMHFGDQSVEADFEWIDSVHVDQQIDVFFPNVWTDQFDRVMKGVGARVVIPGHENEMGHNFEHREPYAQAYERLHRNRDSIPEWYVMSWGERVHIEPRSTDSE
jgi:L-ascorbate metabolism protein UlaG (beta-lactamase superfamily)